MEQKQEGPCQPPYAPNGPSPRKLVQELLPCSAAWAEGLRASEQGGQQGWVAGKEHSTVHPQWEWPRLRGEAG